MLTTPIEGTLRILEQIKDSKKYKLYALTNWSAETWPIALGKYEFLNWFDGIAVSGHEGMRKPDRAFYQLLFDRYRINHHEAIFIDDNLRNVLAARELGIRSVQFTSADELRPLLSAALNVNLD